MSPNIYAKQWDWNLIQASAPNQGHTHKDEFRKAKRETVFEEEARMAKKRQIPAPGAYNMPVYKIRNASIDKQPQMQMA